MIFLANSVQSFIDHTTCVIFASFHQGKEGIICAFLCLFINHTTHVSRGLDWGFILHEKLESNLYISILEKTGFRTETRSSRRTHPNPRTCTRRLSSARSVSRASWGLRNPRSPRSRTGSPP